MGFLFPKAQAENLLFVCAIGFFRVEGGCVVANGASLGVEMSIWLFFAGEEHKCVKEALSKGASDSVVEVRRELTKKMK
ncbi:MAG: hypothetical protein JSV99_05475 [Planctomycetota bacterium]|nr:MAG: hypothetical protein JSV99_05475 [Planctomycetota bacterium]